MWRRSKPERRVVHAKRTLNRPLRCRVHDTSGEKGVRRLTRDRVVLHHASQAKTRGQLCRSNTRCDYYGVSRRTLASRRLRGVDWLLGWQCSQDIFPRRRNLIIENALGRFCTISASKTLWKTFIIYLRVEDRNLKVKVLIGRKIDQGRNLKQIAW